MTPARRGKGEGAIFQRADGRWVASLTVSTPGTKRRRRTLYGRTRKEVQIKLRRAMRERDQGVQTSGTLTVEKWMTYWLDVICIERELKVNTLKSHRSKVEQYIVPAIGRHRLDRLEPEHVRAMYADMRQNGLAPATLRQTHAILRRALMVAQREGKATRNVATLLDPPKVPSNKRMVRLSRADARKILATENLRAHVALMGLRQGEALALRWSDVDLDLGTLEVSRSLARNPGVGLVFGTPKSEAGNRLVPIPPRTLALFKLAALDAYRHHGTMHLSDLGALVFHNGHGQPRDPHRDWREWKTLLAELDIDHVPLHVARNTAASVMEELGYSDREVAELLGQSTVTTTHRYQTGSDERRREMMERAERYMLEG